MLGNYFRFRIFFPSFFSFCGKWISLHLKNWSSESSSANSISNCGSRLSSLDPGVKAASLRSLPNNEGFRTWTISLCTGNVLAPNLMTRLALVDDEYSVSRSALNWDAMRVLRRSNSFWRFSKKADDGVDWWPVEMPSFRSVEAPRTSVIFAWRRRWSPDLPRCLLRYHACFEPQDFMEYIGTRAWEVACRVEKQTAGKTVKMAI